MVKFQDYINSLGLRDKLLELDRRMESRYLMLMKAGYLR